MVLSKILARINFLWILTTECKVSSTIQLLGRVVKDLVRLMWRLRSSLDILWIWILLPSLIQAIRLLSFKTVFITIKKEFIIGGLLILLWDIWWVSLESQGIMLSCLLINNRMLNVSVGLNSISSQICFGPFHYLYRRWIALICLLHSTNRINNSPSLDKGRIFAFLNFNIQHVCFLLFL